MKLLKTTCLVLILCFVSVQSLKVGVINDLHLDPYYNETANPDTYCRFGSPMLSSDQVSLPSVEASPFGHFGCDSPRKLIDLMLKKMNQLDPDVDVILVSGDFLAHGFAVQDGRPDHYEEIKKNIKLVFVDLISSHFPNAIVLPAIGNNDVKYHYKAPAQDDEAQDYYTFFADVLFNQVSGNRMIKTDMIKENFFFKGYYRFDYAGINGDDKLSFIAFNSLYYSIDKPVTEDTIMKEQLNWFEQQLEGAESDRKFVIFFHIFPGEYQVYSETYFWDDESTERFTNIAQAHKDKITIMLGAHTHFGDIRVNIDSKTTKKGSFLRADESGEAQLALLVTPGMTSNVHNNPGFTTFTIENGVAKDIKWVFFELSRFPKTEEEAVFNTVDFAEELGIETWSIKAAQDFLDRLENSTLFFYRYMSHKLGHRGLLEIFGVALYLQIGAIGLLKNNIFFCAARHVLKDGFHQCINN